MCAGTWRGTSTQSKTVVADPIPLDDSDDLRQDLVYHDNQTSRGHIVHHVPHGLGLTLPSPGGQSTTETAELLAEIVNSPILDIPPPNLFLLASAPSNSPADTEIELSQEADSSDVQNDGAPPTVRPTNDKPPHTFSRPRPWRKGSRSYRGLNLSCQHRYRLRSLREISKLEWGLSLWKSWLQIKLATLGSENEAFDDFLRAKIPKNKEIVNILLKYIFSNFVFAYNNWSMLFCISTQFVPMRSSFSLAEMIGKIKKEERTLYDRIGKFPICLIWLWWHISMGMERQ